MSQSVASPPLGVVPVRWVGDIFTGYLELLEQRDLPGVERYVRCSTAHETAQAITDMVVRGAPAIGITAAYGVVLGARALGASLSVETMAPVFAHLRQSRPTAVNLMWAIDRLRRVFESHPMAGAVERLWHEAEAIRTEDLAANLAMGKAGAALLSGDANLLTICNTGSLATAGWGTALGIIRSTHEAGKLQHVFACETRPYLQGARLTMWELMKDGIPATLITDGMVGHLMKTRKIAAVLAGADRIAHNGDTANKIGTYQLAVLARYHDVPFYIAAPTSTVDLNTADGSGIPIEQRGADEVTVIRGQRIAPENAPAFHPAFDVTPAELITGIVTERGVARPDYRASLSAMMQGAR